MTQRIEISPPLSIDDESTWPGEIRHVLDLRRDLLRAYTTERRRIDDLSEADVDTRINPQEVDLLIAAPARSTPAGLRDALTDMISAA